MKRSEIGCREKPSLYVLIDDFLIIVLSKCILWDLFFLPIGVFMSNVLKREPYSEMGPAVYHKRRDGGILLRNTDWNKKSDWEKSQAFCKKKKKKQF